MGTQPRSPFKEGNSGLGFREEEEALGTLMESSSWDLGRDLTGGTNSGTGVNGKPRNK